MLKVATILDVPRLVELGAQLHAASEYKDLHYSREKVGALMANLINGAGVVFVHETNGIVVGGLAGGVTEHWFSTEKHGFDYSFFIEPSARHGVTAIRLINAFKIWCKARGARSIRMGITTGINPEGTAAFYRRIGFTDAGVLFNMEL